MLSFLQHSESQTESTLVCFAAGRALPAGSTLVTPLLIKHVQSTMTPH